MATQRKLAPSPPLTHADTKVHVEQTVRAVSDLQTRLAEHLEHLENILNLGASRPDVTYFLGQW
ncbi:MAG: hypothetical protein AB1405_07800 [Bdellovibrionota bacterium]